MMMETRIIFVYNTVLTSPYSYLSHSLRQLHEVPTDPRNAGVCAFAAMDMERGEVVVEYEGEVIDSEEAREREKRYEEEQGTCATMFLKSKGYQVAQVLK